MSSLTLVLASCSPAYIIAAEKMSEHQFCDGKESDPSAGMLLPLCTFSLEEFLVC